MHKLSSWEVIAVPSAEHVAIWLEHTLAKVIELLEDAAWFDP